MDLFANPTIFLIVSAVSGIILLFLLSRLLGGSMTKLKLVSLIFLSAVICISLAVLRDPIPQLQIIHQIPGAQVFLDSIRDGISTVIVNGDIKGIIGIIFAPVTGILALARYLKETKTQAEQTIKEVEDVASLKAIEAQQQINTGLEDVKKLSEKLESTTDAYNEQTKAMNSIVEKNLQLEKRIEEMRAEYDELNIQYNENKLTLEQYKVYNKT